MIRRWYLWCMVPIPTAAVACEVYFPFRRDPPDSYADMISICLLAVLFLLWESWVVSYFLAGDPPPKHLARPRATLLGISLGIWKVAILADVIAGGILVIYNAERHHMGWGRPRLLWIGPIVAILVALHAVCWRWNLRVRARFRAVAGQRVCLSCGYDLRGTAPGAACPECGTPRPVAMPTATSSAA